LKKDSDDGFAKVDVDAKKGFGPETISVKTLRKGTYKFFAHNYDGILPMWKAEGKVVVYHDDDIIAEINMPTTPVTDDPQNKKLIWGVGRLVRDEDGKENFQVKNVIVEKTNQF